MIELELKKNGTGKKIYVNEFPSIDLMPEGERKLFVSSIFNSISAKIEKKANKMLNKRQKPK